MCASLPCTIIVGTNIHIISADYNARARAYAKRCVALQEAEERLRGLLAVVHGHTNLKQNAT
jgi:hypothetical protein